MKSINVKACNNCGIIYVPTARQQKYCADCAPIVAAAKRKEWRNMHPGYNKKYRKPVKKITFCVRCGAEYERTSNSQKFCVNCRSMAVIEGKQRWRLEHAEYERMKSRERYYAHHNGESMAEKRAKREQLAKEMLQKREEGLTNKDIAKYLKLPYYTVFRYIGKEPVEYWKNAVRIGAKTRRAKNKLHSIGLNQRKKVWYEIQIREQQAVFDKALLDLDLKRKEYDEQQKKAFEEQQKLNELKKALEAC